MIGVDVDQIYGTLKLDFFAYYLYRNKMAFCHEKGALILSSNSPCIPKEIYNIISIEEIFLSSVKNKLVIGDKIINLHNIKSILIQESPNVIISRKILNLPSFMCFSDDRSGYKAVNLYDRDFKKFIIESTTVLSERFLNNKC